MGRLLVQDHISYLGPSTHLARAGQTPILHLSSPSIPRSLSREQTLQARAAILIPQPRLMVPAVLKAPFSGAQPGGLAPGPEFEPLLGNRPHNAFFENGVLSLGGLGEKAG